MTLPYERPTPSGIKLMHVLTVLSTSARCGLTAGALVLLVALTACGPRVKSFTVDPRPMPAALPASEGVTEICHGEGLAMRWDTRGTAGMALRLGDVRFASREKGEELDPLQPDTLYLTLQATEGDPNAPSKADVETVYVLMYPDTAADVVTFQADLHGDTLVARGERLASKRLSIVRAFNPMNRTLFVAHGGKNAALVGAGAASDVFRGAPLGERWELRSLMSDAEKASPPAERPKTLTVGVIVRCQGTPR